MRTINAAILFSGNGSNLENIVCFFRDKTIESTLKTKNINFNIKLAICNNKDAFGIKRCENLGLKTIVINHKDFASREEFDKQIAKILLESSINLVILAGFMRILSADFVKQFKCINIHPSFLPLYKGANAIKESFEGGEDFGGVSVHWVDENLDSGALILQEKIPKIKGESLQDFESRIHALEHKLYPQAILKILSEL